MKSEFVSVAIRSLIQTEHLHRSVFDHARSRVGLHSRSQHWALLYMEQKGGRLSSQRELADFLEISPAAVAVMLKGLESSGYIERSVSDGDGRSREARLTERGHEALLRTRCFFHEIDEAMLEGIDERDLEIFIACQKRMQENLRRMEGAENAPAPDAKGEKK